MIKVTFSNQQKLLDRRNAQLSIQICIDKIDRNKSVWYFEVEKGIFYFNYNDSNIIKSIEKVKGWR